MSEKLRPCPFCGGENLYMDNMMPDETEWHFIVCADCWAEGPMCTTSGPVWDDPSELAKLAWNGQVK